MDNSNYLSDVTSRNFTEKKSLNDIANALGCTYDTIQRAAKKLGFTKNGVKTMLNEAQVSQILISLQNGNPNRVHLPQDLSKVSTSLTPALKIKQAMEMMQSAYEEELQMLRAKQIEDAPKVEFYNQVTDSTDAIDMGNVAKLLNLGIGRNRLFEILRDNRILQSNNIPYQKYIDAGYFRVIESKFTTPNGETHINLKTVVYQSGVDFIRNLIINRTADKMIDSLMEER